MHHAELLARDYPAFLGHWFVDAADMYAHRTVRYNPSGQLSRKTNFPGS